MSDRTSLRIHLYVAAVSTAGIGTLAFSALHDAAGLTAARSVQFWVLAAFVIFGELCPIRTRRHDEVTEVTTSEAFAFALLLTSGLPAAALALGLASVVGDVRDRKPWWKAVFNVGQYTLSMAGAAAVLRLLAGHHWGADRGFDPSDLLVSMAAAVAFFAVNVVLTGGAMVLTRRLPLLSFFRYDLALQAGTAMAFSPIVVIVAQRSLLFLPLLVAPLAAAYRSAAVSLAKEHQALHDGLTGLANRALFQDRAQQAITAAHRDNTRTALLVLDLDRFKEVNDNLGHHVGDQLLQGIAARWRDVLRDSDTVARLGGDEFGVVLRHVTDAADALGVAERIRQALEPSFMIDGTSLDVGASVGVAVYPEHGEDADTLIRCADAAMYVAKEARIGAEVYSPSVSTEVGARISLVGELRDAIEAEQLVLHYQPKLCLRTGQAIGVEALVRWEHPTRGLIPPDQFIPLAEQSGLMRPLTLYVLDHALRQLSLWKEYGIDLSMAVNVSSRNLHDLKFPDDVSRLLARWGVAAGSLELEITESAIMVDQLRSTAVLHRLSSMGVGIAIDDFGTGYSSLAYLQRLPVNTIKLDKSFITDLATQKIDAVIARATIDLGSNLGMEIVAEGVETGAVMEKLAAMGCDMAQGYYVCRPVPSDELLTWLLRRGDEARAVPSGDLATAL